MLSVTNSIHRIQGMISRITGTGICYGMEMKVKKAKTIRISMKPFQIQIRIDQKQLETVEYFNYLGSLIRIDARCTYEIKSRIAMAKAAFNMKKTLFTRKLDSNLRQKLVKCYTQSTAFYGAETWTLQEVHHKNPEGF